MNYVFGKERVSLKKEGLTSEKIKDFTLNLCDEDYNGNNGYDYFKEITEEEYNRMKEAGYDVAYENESYLASYFDYLWHGQTRLRSEEEILRDAARIMENILKDNYDSDDCSYSFGIAEVVETQDEIVAIVGYADYV